MATRLPPAESVFASAFRPYGEGNEMLPLCPCATAAAGWSAGAVALVALVALVVVHLRFTFVKH
jgi:hypothetical protein